MYFAQLLVTARHELNRSLSGVLIWYIPLIILSLFLILGPFLRKVKIRSTDLQSLIGSGLLVVGAFISAGLAGIMTIGFGMCYGKDCSEQVQVATGLIPALFSLFITVPISAQLLRKSSQTQYIEKNKISMPFLILGIVILLWSSVVYVPRIVKAIDKYQSSQTIR